MIEENYIKSVDLDAKIRELHERVADVGSLASRFQQADRDFALVLAQTSTAFWITDDILRLTTYRGCCDIVLGKNATRESVLTDLCEPGNVLVTASTQALQGNESRTTLTCGSRSFALHIRPIRDSYQQITGTFATAVEIAGLPQTAGTPRKPEINSDLVQGDREPAAVKSTTCEITDPHRAEEQIRQSQKMEAIGVLAGGIAHDFNNLLTGILGYAYLLQTGAPEDGDTCEALDAIVKAAERAAHLTAQLLTFARKHKDQDVPVDVHALINQVVTELEGTLDKRILIGRALSAHSPEVMGDPAQLRQLVLNLCQNARDAMPDGGALTLSTEDSAGAVVITVTDTGTGIPTSIRDRIFEPFFTTKSPDKGAGMGLAIVYGIVRNHGGAVWADTAPGAGSSFHVSLPARALSTASQPEPQISAPALRVLVIDDEEIIRKVLARMLKGLGYDSAGASNGPQGIEYYRNHARDVDVVILDMVMPGMTGREVYNALREINPNVRVVLSSGYSPDSSGEALVKETGIEFLQKPYQIEQLSAALQRACAGTATSA